MPLPRRPRIALTTCLCLTALALGGARAEPVPAAPGDATTAEPIVLDATVHSAAEFDAWVLRETTEALMQRQVDIDRLAVVRQGFSWRAPTWIQNAAAVNLGDFPTLQDPTAKAERDLRTLEWLIEERNRRGGAQRVVNDDAEPPSGWLRQLLPTQWVGYLKAHRELVLMGGATVLLLLWGGAAAQQRRRPGGTATTTPPSTMAAADEPPRSRHRRRRRSHHRHAPVR